MSQFVTLINSGSKTYKEEFKGKMIELKPKGTIRMERYEAKQFLGTVGTSNPDKGVEKNIEILKTDPMEEKPTEVEFISHLDGKKFFNQADLDAHLKTLNPAASGAEVLTDEDIDTAKKRKNLLKG